MHGADQPAHRAISFSGSTRYRFERASSLPFLPRQNREARTSVRAHTQAESPETRAGTNRECAARSGDRRQNGPRPEAPKEFGNRVHGSTHRFAISYG